jgi:hypothetical protein
LKGGGDGTTKDGGELCLFSFSGSVSVLISVSVSVSVSTSGLSIVVGRTGESKHSELKFDRMEGDGEGVGAIGGKENAISGAGSGSGTTSVHEASSDVVG